MKKKLKKEEKLIKKKKSTKNSLNIDKKKYEKKVKSQKHNKKTILNNNLQIHRLKYPLGRSHDQANSSHQLAHIVKLYNHKNNIIISRSDGSVELVSSYPHFHSLAFFAGLANITFDSVIYCNTKLILASSSIDTFCILDFHSYQLEHVQSSCGGGIFDVASYENNDDNNLVTACEDGSIRVWKVYQENEIAPLLEYAIPTVGNAVLSLETTMNNTIYAGVGDGTIRKYTNKKPQWRITIPTKGSRQPTRVWALKSLRQKYLVAGTSLGQILVMDQEHGFVLKTFQQNEFHVDVFCLVENRNSIYAAGVSGQITIMECIEEEFFIKGFKRAHAHDITTMCSSHDFILCGSLDTTLSSMNVHSWNIKSHYSHSYFTYIASISCSDSQIIAWLVRENNFKTRIQLTKLEDVEPNQEKSYNQNPFKCKTSIELSHESTFHYTRCLLSPSAKLLVVGNSLNLLFYWLSPKYDEFEVIPLDCTNETITALSCSAMKFISDDLLLCITMSNDLYVIEFDLKDFDTYSITIRQALDLDTTRVSFQTNLDPLEQVLPVQILSLNDKWLALLQYTSPFSTSFNSTNEATIQVFQIHNSDLPENNLTHYWTFQPMTMSKKHFTNTHNVPTSIQIHDMSIIITFSNHVFQMYNLTAKQLSDWNIDNAQDKLPRNLIDFPIQIIPMKQEIFMLRGFDAFCMVDLALPIPKKAFLLGSSEKDNKEINFCVCNKFQGMLFMKYFIDKQQIILVELNWKNDILKILNDPLERKVFGR